MVGSNLLLKNILDLYLEILFVSPFFKPLGDIQMRCKNDLEFRSYLNQDNIFPRWTTSLICYTTHVYHPEVNIYNHLVVSPEDELFTKCIFTLHACCTNLITFKTASMHKHYIHLFFYKNEIKSILMTCLVFCNLCNELITLHM